MEKTGIRKYDIHRLCYFDEAKLVGSHNMPQLEPQQLIPHDVVSFNERNTVRDPANHWLDFFIDDEGFECCWNELGRSVLAESDSEKSSWTRLDSYIPIFEKFEGVIATDYSMFPEMMPDQRNWNCARNRIYAFRLQQHGIPCIPVASWCSEDDWSWCFDGLPEKSTIAVSTNGCCHSAQGRECFRRGIDELERQKAPFAIVVCGRSFAELEGCSSNLLFYPAFSQRMGVRINGR